ncbi:MAG: hypothetical protein HYT43_02740 [Candidatus Taylorbacteria bacterium]|nr:hypothetical protein [Candidatus Taylorbacteria bacterium]
MTIALALTGEPERLFKELVKKFDGSKQLTFIAALSVLDQMVDWQENGGAIVMRGAGGKELHLENIIKAVKSVSGQESCLTIEPEPEIRTFQE